MNVVVLATLLAAGDPLPSRDALAQGLVPEVNALMTKRYPRPVHVGVAGADPRRAAVSSGL